MNIVSKTKQHRSGLAENGGSEIAERKRKHLTVCLEEEGAIQTGSTRFCDISFVHNPLPEIDYDKINTHISFLGSPSKMPVFISCMTGGAEEGKLANRDLAVAAEKCGVAVGLGSIRILFDDEAVFDHFHIKPLCPSVPVIANLSAVQLKVLPEDRLIEVLKRLEVQALAVHLNPGQELFQQNGDRDFTGLYEAIEKCADTLMSALEIPLIVKETGFGISPAVVKRLENSGVRFVDIAGSGGTNWAAVEAVRDKEPNTPHIDLFKEWGIPTALAVAAASEILYGNEHPVGFRTKKSRQCDVLSSGGIRNAMDVAKSLALGATAVGIALPLIKAVLHGGPELVVEYLQNIKKDLKAIMLLVGASTVEELRKKSLLFKQQFRDDLAGLMKSISG